MKKVLLVLMLLGASLIMLRAQTQYSFTVHFATDEHRLNQESLKTLQSLVKKTETAPKFEITLTAHTDFVGNEAYNMKLSEKRAESVKQKLLNMGIPSSVIKTGHFGEYKPVAENESEEGKQMNRRVQITLNIYPFKNGNEVLQQLRTTENYQQTFKLTCNCPQAITGKKGTVLKFPANAFKLPDGTPVSNQDVSVELEEFHSHKDAILNGLSTMSNGQILESGGMFKITAKLGDRDLELREGKSVDVELPSNYIQPGMSVFVGQRNENNIVDWEITQNRFETENEEKVKVSLKFDEEKLKSFLVEQPDIKDYVRDTNRLIIQLPFEPSLLSKPREPTLPTKLTHKQYFSPFQLVFMPKSMREARINKSYDQQMAIYNKRLERYEKRQALFEKRLDAYGIVKAEYEIKLQEFQDYLILLKAEINEKYKELCYIYDAPRWNKAVENSIDLNRKQKLYTNDFLGYLSKESNKNIPFSYKYEMIQLLKKMEFVEFLQRTDISDLPKQYRSSQTIVFKPSKDRNDLNRYGYQLNHNTVAADFISQEQDKLRQLAYEAQLERTKLLEASGTLDTKEVNNVYKAALPRLGYINCDRFTATPQTLMVDIEIYKKDGESITLVLPDINSVIYPINIENEKVIFRVPRQQRVKMLVVGVDDGKATFESREAVAINLQKTKTKAENTLLSDLKAKIDAFLS